MKIINGADIRGLNALSSSSSSNAARVIPTNAKVSFATSAFADLSSSIALTISADLDSTQIRREKRAMRKVILSAAISFDGFIEGPNGEIDWIIFGEQEGASDLLQLVDEIDTVIYGRVSYELWGNPEITDASSDFEKKFNGAIVTMDRYVFSRTKTEFEGNATAIGGGAAELVNDLKSKPGKNIWLYGGSKLITTFMNLDLVDEFWLGVMPVILGNGKPLFANVENRHRLRLKHSKPSPSGAIGVRYETVRQR